MPTLKEKIQKDLNDALRSGDQLKRLVLGMAANSIKNKELAKRAQFSKTISNIDELETKSRLNDEEVIETIASEIKKRREAIEQFSAGGRAELAQKEKMEMEILLGYMPRQISQAEIKSEIDKVIKEVGAKDIKDMGKVIGLVMAKVRGRADGDMVSRLVKESLAI